MCCIMPRNHISKVAVRSAFIPSPGSGGRQPRIALLGFTIPKDSRIFLKKVSTHAEEWETVVRFEEKITRGEGG